MKPIEEQKTITIYKCADCGKESGNQTHAEQCCACSGCGGPTSAEDKKIAKGGLYFYSRDLLCEWCRVRKEVKTQQDKVRRQEDDVKNAQRRLEAEQRELKQDQDTLTVLLAKRDALPPKPRQKKDSAA